MYSYCLGRYFLTSLVEIPPGVTLPILRASRNWKPPALLLSVAFSVHDLLFFLKKKKEKENTTRLPCSAVTLRNGADSTSLAKFSFRLTSHGKRVKRNTKAESEDAGICGKTDKLTIMHITGQQGPDDAG